MSWPTLQQAIAVMDKSAERTTPNVQTEAWAVIRPYAVAVPELLEALEYIAGITGYANCDNCNEVSGAANAAITIAAAAGATE